MSSTICSAIRERKRLRFYYNGMLREVEPYCLGITRAGNAVLRAIQVAGATSAGRGDHPGAGLGFGKLWHVSKLERLEVTSDSFAADDPHYNPNDSAMARIHCRVERR